MGVKLKRLSEQTVVITGASSGIGLATARMAAKRGARLVLTARNDEALRQIVDDINADGGSAVHVAGDVANEDDLRRVAAAAVEHFGGFDTWVNNAGVSIFGPVLEVSTEDHRRLFETNFWGVVYGSRVAAEHLRKKGGAIVNVGSTLSDRAIPVQGMYSVTKHAVKGFTDVLRMELEHEGAPVSVSLVKPSSIDTPFTVHAKNYMPMEPTIPPPVYAPEVVAEVILHCCETPERDIFAGGAGKLLSASGHYAPRLTDRYMEATMFAQQQSDRPTLPGRRDSLHAPMDDGFERGDYPGHVSESSLYNKAARRPLLATAVIAGAGLALAAWLLPSARASARKLRTNGTGGH